MYPDKPIYLASPYTHECEAVQDMRFKAVAQATVALTNLGFLVFSPIVNSIPLHGITGVGTTWDYWQTIDKAWIKACQAVWVFAWDGWQTSVGVQAEIKFALENDIPVRYVDPLDYTVTEEPVL